MLRVTYFISMLGHITLSEVFVSYAPFLTFRDRLNSIMVYHLKTTYLYKNGLGTPEVNVSCTDNREITFF